MDTGPARSTLHELPVIVTDATTKSIYCIEWELTKADLGYQPPALPQRRTAAPLDIAVYADTFTLKTPLVLPGRQLKIVARKLVLAKGAVIDVSGSDADVGFVAGDLPQQQQVEAPPGTYALPITGRKPTGGPMQALVQLPQGYQIGDGWYIQSGPKDTAPDWNGLAVWDVKGVYSHPCQEGATPVDPGPSVTDLAKAIAAQPMRAASDPIPVRIAGYEGQYVQWSVPDDADFSQCPAGKFNSYTDAGGGTRWQQGPGQVDRLWILDVDGNRVVINAFHGPASTKDQIAAVTEMVDTIAFSTAT